MINIQHVYSLQLKVSVICVLFIMAYSLLYIMVLLLFSVKVDNL